MVQKDEWTEPPPNVPDFLKSLGTGAQLFCFEGAVATRMGIAQWATCLLTKVAIGIEPSSESSFSNVGSPVKYKAGIGGGEAAIHLVAWRANLESMMLQCTELYRRTRQDKLRSKVIEASHETSMRGGGLSPSDTAAVKILEQHIELMLSNDKNLVGDFQVASEWKRSAEEYWGKSSTVETDQTALEKQNKAHTDRNAKILTPEAFAQSTQLSGWEDFSFGKMGDVLGMLPLCVREEAKRIADSAGKKQLTLHAMHTAITSWLSGDIPAPELGGQGGGQHGALEDKGVTQHEKLSYLGRTLLHCEHTYAHRGPRSELWEDAMQRFAVALRGTLNDPSGAALGQEGMDACEKAVFAYAERCAHGPGDWKDAVEPLANAFRDLLGSSGCWGGSAEGAERVRKVWTALKTAKDETKAGFGEGLGSYDKALRLVEGSERLKNMLEKLVKDSAADNAARPQEAPSAQDLEPREWLVGVIVMQSRMSIGVVQQAAANLAGSWHQPTHIGRAWHWHSSGVNAYLASGDRLEATSDVCFHAGDQVRMRLDPKAGSLSFYLLRPGYNEKHAGTLHGISGSVLPGVCLQYQGDAAELSPAPHDGKEEARPDLDKKTAGPTEINTQTDIPVQIDPYGAKAYYTTPEGRYWHAQELIAEAAAAMDQHKGKGTWSQGFAYVDVGHVLTRAKACLAAARGMLDGTCAQRQLLVYGFPDRMSSHDIRQLVESKLEAGCVANIKVRTDSDYLHPSDHNRGNLLRENRVALLTLKDVSQFHAALALDGRMHEQLYTISVVRDDSAGALLTVSNAPPATETILMRKLFEEKVGEEAVSTVERMENGSGFRVTLSREEVVPSALSLDKTILPQSFRMSFKHMAETKAGEGDRRGNEGQGFDEKLMAALARVCSMQDELSTMIGALRWEAERRIKDSLRALKEGDLTTARTLVDSAQDSVGKMPKGQLLAVEQKELERELGEIQTEMDNVIARREAALADHQKKQDTVMEERLTSQRKALHGHGELAERVKEELLKTEKEIKLETLAVATEITKRFDKELAALQDKYDKCMEKDVVGRLVQAQNAISAVKPPLEYFGYGNMMTRMRWLIQRAEACLRIRPKKGAKIEPVGNPDKPQCDLIMCWECICAAKEILATPLSHDDLRTLKAHPEDAVLTQKIRSRVQTKTEESGKRRQASDPIPETKDASKEQVKRSSSMKRSSSLRSDTSKNKDKEAQHSKEGSSADGNREKEEDLNKASDVVRAGSTYVQFSDTYIEGGKNQSSTNLSRSETSPNRDASTPRGGLDKTQMTGGKHEHRRKGKDVDVHDRDVKDDPAQRVHVTLKMLKEALEGNLVPLDRHKDLRDLVDEIYVLSRRLAILEDYFNEQARPMRDIVASLVKVIAVGLDDNSVQEAARSLREAEDLERRLPKDYRSLELPRFRQKIDGIVSERFATADKERRKKWDTVTGTKFVSDVFLSYDDGPPISMDDAIAHQGVKGVHISTELASEHVKRAQQKREAYALFKEIKLGVEQKGWQVASDDGTMPLVKEGGQEVGMRLTCEGKKEEAHLISVLPGALADLSGKVATQELADALMKEEEKRKKDKEKLEKARKEEAETERNSRLEMAMEALGQSVSDKQDVGTKDGATHKGAEADKDAPSRTQSTGSAAPSRTQSGATRTQSGAAVLKGGEVGAHVRDDEPAALFSAVGSIKDETKPVLKKVPEVCVVDEGRFEIVRVMHVWEREREEEKEHWPFSLDEASDAKKDELKDGEGEGRWVTHCDVRVIESVRMRGGKVKDWCSCEEIASAVYAGVMARDESVSKEGIACYACAWPWALAPRRKDKGMADAERVERKMRLSVLVAPIVSDLYFARAQPAFSESKAHTEVRAMGKVKGSGGIVPLVFGHVRMPSAWRGPIGDACMHSSGADCVGPYGVDEAVRVLDERLREMGMKPRGERDEEKEKVRSGKPSGEPRHVFVDALLRSVEEHEEAAKRGGKGREIKKGLLGVAVEERSGAVGAKRVEKGLFDAGVTGKSAQHDDKEDNEELDRLMRLKVRGVHGCADALRLASIVNK